MDFHQFVKEQLRGPLRRAMELTGVPAGVRSHLQDRVVKSTVARLKAIPRAGRMWAGTEILWPRPGVAAVGLLEVPAPGLRQVLVRADFTAVSPGTERAFLNLLPGVSAKFPARPGYSGAGTVVAVGRGVQGVKLGQSVACTEMPHASLSLLPEDRVFSLPEGVPLEEAAFIQLVIIAQQGVRKGQLQPGCRATVVGAGLIGQLVVQLARLEGAASVSVVAASAAKRALALQSGADHFIELGANHADLRGLESDVVIEATGNPEALFIAAQTAAAGGRVVLLGSTRGVNANVDFDQLLRRRELTLIGAHISTVPESPSPDCPISYREEAAQAIALMAARKLAIEPLIGERVHPLEAPLFYRRLCRGESRIVGAVLAWQQLPDTERCRRSFFLLAPPDLLRRGRPFDQNDGAPSVITRKRSQPPLAEAIGVLPAASGPLRFGLIGCGGMGARHAQALRDAPNTVLVATMDPNEGLARDLAAGAFYTTSVEALLARPDVDAVFVATPNHLHESIGTQAARSGKHVVMEKPMATNLAGADRLLTACREANVALSVGYSFRYMPEIRIARRLVREGVLGRLLTVQFTCYLDRSPAYWGSGVTGRAHSTWRGAKDKAGGGVFIMNMSHQLDQIRYILGKDIKRVMSVAGVLDSPPGVEVEDVISIACEFEGGGIGSFFGASCARGLENLMEIRLVGDTGSIVLDAPPRFYSLRSFDGSVPGRWHSFGPLPKVDVHVSYLAWFADAVLRGAEPDINGEDGRAVQAWIEAAYRSALLRRPVDLAEVS